MKKVKAEALTEVGALLRRAKRVKLRKKVHKFQYLNLVLHLAHSKLSEALENHKNKKSLTLKSKYQHHKS